jgi:hypothetical protein
MTNGPRVRGLLAMAAVCACATARAAGGHFGVDDATLLEPGQWEQESWYSHAPGGGEQVHAGFNFRVGPVELDGAGERTRIGEPASTTWNLEVKWARPVTDRLAVGLDLQPAWRSGTPGTRFYGIATWKLLDTLDLHLNAGRDWWRHDTDFARGGASLEWAALAQWTFIAERFLDTGTNFFRAGARWSPNPHWTWDVSYAQRVSGPAPSNWTLGLTYHSDGQ